MRVKGRVRQGAGIVPLLEVDDLGQARAMLVRGDAELLGGPGSDGTWTWLGRPMGTTTAWAPA